MNHTCEQVLLFKSEKSGRLISVTGIGPESFRFTSTLEARPFRDSESYYILRPEAIEGWFYLWRVTKKQIYRDWCWEAAQAIERHCRSESGYSGIRNVNAVKVCVVVYFFKTIKIYYY